MNKQSYRQARKSYRANGSCALRWMTPAARTAMVQLRCATDDKLQHRAWLASCAWGGATTAQVIKADMLFVWA